MNILSSTDTEVDIRIYCVLKLLRLISEYIVFYRY